MAFPLPNFFKTEVIKVALKKVAGDNDTKTTVLGVAASAVLAGQIDWGKLFQKDPQQIGLLVGALVTAVYGYYTNKPNKA